MKRLKIIFLNFIVISLMHCKICLDKDDLPLLLQPASSPASWRGRH